MRHKKIVNPMTTQRAKERFAALWHPSMEFMNTLDGQIKEIETHKNICPQAGIRKIAYSLGLLENIKPRAEYVVVAGCFAPLIAPNVLASYFRVLDKVGIEFTVLDDEYCCGWVPLETAAISGDPEAIAKAGAASKKFLKANVDAAVAKGAKKMLQFCEWCVFAHKWGRQEGAFDAAGQQVEQMSLLEPVFERLNGIALRLNKPTVIGYYEGCHLRSDHVFPEVEVEWSDYRAVLDKIENLKVVDLPNPCCVADAEKVVAAAKAKHVDALVCRCYTCWAHVARAAKNSIPVKFIPEIIDRALAPAA